MSEYQSAERMKMLKKAFSILFVFCILTVESYAQEQIEVLTLGVFHFDFPNLDAVKIKKEEQIDVYSVNFQEEIQCIADRLAQFNPQAIVVEYPIDCQSEIDSIYNAYIMGKHRLSRSEVQQLGFRIAKQCHSKIFCADAWGAPTVAIESLMKNQNSEQYIAFENSFVNTNDSALYFKEQPILKEKGILSELIRLNNLERIKRDMGNYLIGPFKYEFEKGDYTGVDFETGRWFSRNLRIFRNIQRINTQKKERILVIFGAGHMSLLNYLLECSPEYKLLNVNTYLKQP